MNPVAPAARALNWLVGDHLALVLHIGDGPLAYELADQGHDVTIVGDDVTTVRHQHISYVRSQGDLLPFRSRSFEAVVAPEIDDEVTALGEYARVLTDDGLLSTIARRYDDSIPWMRKLRTITGDRSGTITPVATFTASGLFREPERQEFNAWEELDFPTLMRFAETTKHPSVPGSALAAVRDLWREYGEQTGSLRLRHETVCLRARVDKSQLAAEPDPPDTVLIDFR